MKTILLSDLHIGVNAPTNLYQTSEHEPSLKAILKYIKDNGNQIRDVVILGDWVDLWMYPSTAIRMNEMPPEGKRNNFLPTVEQIFEANPNIFTRQPDGLDFVSCLDYIKGDLYYVNGNHDITVTEDQINSYLPNTAVKKIKYINCSTEPAGYTSEVGDIYAEHGHWYSLLCRPKPYLLESVPLGYFITRVGMDAEIYTQKPLPGLNVQEIKATMKTYGYTFSQAILQIVAAQANTDLDKLNFNMPSGNILSANDVASKFPFPDDSVDNPDFVNADIDGTLDPNALELFTYGRNKNLELVLFGHTHISKVFQDFRTQQNSIDVKATYANTGFLCAGSPNMNTGLPVATFVEIEDTGNDVNTPGNLPYKVNMRNVDFASSTISTEPLCSLNVTNLGNLAFNKPVKASSVEKYSDGKETPFTPNKAVDGNDSTRWSSASCSTKETLPPQWIYVDLVQDYTIDKVVLSWEAAYAKSYNIAVSSDAENWTEVYSTTTGKGYVENIQFSAPVRARYVRMYGTERGLNPTPYGAVHGYSLYEFSVYAPCVPATQAITMAK